MATIINRRGKFLVYPNFQLKFIAFLFSIFMISIAVLYGSYLYFFWKLKRIGIQFGLPEDGPFFALISKEQGIMNEIALIGVIVLLVFICIAGVIFSHRICGPIVRLKQEVDKITCLENCPELRFRKNDVFFDFAEAFNSMIKRLKKSE